MDDADKTREQLIDELKRLRTRNAELEDSERKFRVLAESSNTQISVVRDNRYRYANQAFLDYYGVDLEDLMLTTVDDLTLGNFSAEEIQRIMPQVAEAAAKGETHFRVEMQDTEGRWFLTHATQTELEEEDAFIAMSFDITEHKRAVEALEESETKFRGLAEMTTAHISIVQDDHYVYANQAFLDYYYLDAETLKKVTPEELMMGAMGPDAVKAGEAAWRAAVGEGKTRFHFDYLDAEGHWFQTNVTMMELACKESVLVTNIDITETKRAQSELYRADKMAALGQVIAGVAHEINNPNNFIYFNLPILRRYIEAVAPLIEDRLATEPGLKIMKMPPDAFLQDIFKLLENMEHGSSRITSIVADLKHYVRSDEDQDRRPQQVGRTVDRVMTLVGKQVRKMVRSLDVEVADDLPDVEMNAGKIEQVLINLLINAGQAADKEDSRVTLKARMDAAGDERIELLVEDNGAGIPGDRLDRIFEPFYTSKGRDQGTGLGLSISHRIVEEHGGTLTVVSTPGEGSCFTVRLPVGTLP